LFERRQQARQYAELAVQRGRGRRFIDTVLETIDVGVVVADPLGRVTVFNRADREWHGLGPEPDLAPSDVPDHYGLFDASGARRLGEDEIPLLRALRGTRSPAPR
jgi:PAS domain-containing protein